MAITVKPHQCLFDIVLRETGSISSVFTIAMLNDINITDELTGGQVLETTGATILDNSVTTYYRDFNIYPGTSLTLDSATISRGGIGFMGIGIDFKIS
ncbi:hypothetical protein [Chitinophaga flava]|uniref:Uncharacterized protein n=1 Tax=Chitinophaga flava TaxID=2259036 RepID=A0A365XQX2_9BACT|nr:hypothetical protein [Chitinophaga flava]RBL88528.1 hypothetical protein DF182_18285 [Chitinophaga flava]